MVEIREESSEPYNPSTSAGTSRAQSNGRGQNFVTISQYISENTMECCLLITRLMTLFFALCYLFPFLSPVAVDSAYYKTFAAAAATNALRMQQRVGLVSFSRDFLSRLLLEDSCHYLFYSILFLISAPVTMTLLPITFFAALHAASQVVKLLTAIGKGQSSFALRLASLTQQHTANCLGIIACGEIFLIPLLIAMVFVRKRYIFSGKASLFVPFIYYRFLTLRYTSRRNPNTRQAFTQMRYSLDEVAASTLCPQIVRQLIHSSVRLISRLAPAV
ncbi:hypothetical protein DICVIV_08858 [Dictyocaulus viviparus]|uniref:Transmembrane protein 33 family protein n=1 Tax=Dictyocaulus viviparus TaxID=29172 RepID=A0A0D8XRT3_DICVI|nr:hypothetical protein DICVIV_08858 [Dictyocaulus viviparus]